MLGCSSQSQTSVLSVPVKQFSSLIPGVLKTIWHQTYVRTQFLRVTLSALKPCLTVDLGVEGKRLWISCDLEGLGSGFWPTQQPTHTATRQALEAEYYTSHRPMLCLTLEPQKMWLAPFQGGQGASDHHALWCWSSLLLELLFGKMSDPVLLHNHLLWPTPNQTL
jgi:hypothetical protein